MLSETIEKTLNNQINAEYYSSYLYFGLAMDFGKVGLMGFCHWFKLQAKEEYEHAKKIADYILDKGGTVKLEDIKAHEVEWKVAADAMRAVLDHERFISKRIDDILTEARKEMDYGTENLMNWFVKEQIEEESTVNGVCKYLEFVGPDDKNGLLYIDKILGERTSNPCYR